MSHAPQPGWRGSRRGGTEGEGRQSRPSAATVVDSVELFDTFDYTPHPNARDHAAAAPNAREHAAATPHPNARDHAAAAPNAREHAAAPAQP
jgi:hypothetical protein